MTKLLEKAFAKAAKLSKREQDLLARWLLEELDADREWDEAFARSENQLSRLAEQALAEHKAGKTKPLNVSRL